MNDGWCNRTLFPERRVTRVVSWDTIVIDGKPTSIAITVEYINGELDRIIVNPNPDKRTKGDVDHGQLAIQDAEKINNKGWFTDGME